MYNYLALSENITGILTLNPAQSDTSDTVLTDVLQLYVYHYEHTVYVLHNAELSHTQKKKYNLNIKQISLLI